MGVTMIADDADIAADWSMIANRTDHAIRLPPPLRKLDPIYGVTHFEHTCDI